MESLHVCELGSETQGYVASSCWIWIPFECCIHGCEALLREASAWCWYPHPDLATILVAENIQEQVFSVSSSSSPLRFIEGGSVKYIRPSSPSRGVASRQLFRPLPSATNENIMGIQREIFNWMGWGGHSLWRFAKPKALTFVTMAVKFLPPADSA